MIIIEHVSSKEKKWIESKRYSWINESSKHSKWWKIIHKTLSRSRKSFKSFKSTFQLRYNDNSFKMTSFCSQQKIMNKLHNNKKMINNHNPQCLLNIQNYRNFQNKVSKKRKLIWKNSETLKELRDCLVDLLWTLCFFISFSTLYLKIRVLLKIKKWWRLIIKWFLQVEARRRGKALLMNFFLLFLPLLSPSLSLDSRSHSSFNLNFIVLYLHHNIYCFQSFISLNSWLHNFSFFYLFFIC